jgi:hypothetical protein
MIEFVSKYLVVWLAVAAAAGGVWAWVSYKRREAASRMGFVDPATLSCAIGCLGITATVLTIVATFLTIVGLLIKLWQQF